MILSAEEIDAIETRKKPLFWTKEENDETEWQKTFWFKLIASHRAQSKLIAEQAERMKELETVYCALECP